MLIRLKSIRLLLLLPIAVIVIGTVGFMILERLSFVDSLYLTIVTISTVGYGDISPSNIASKIFCIILIIFGIGTFLTIVTSIAQILIHRGQNRLRTRRLNMIIGVFFTEVGNELLRMFVQFDPGINEIREDCLINQECSEMDFASIRSKLQHYEYAIEPKLMDLGKLSELLKGKGDLLLRQIENPSLIEHESFTELLWSVIHLRDELMSRKSLIGLSEVDTEHLANDTKRAYNALARRWIDYMNHLKRSYPYLFSLAIRTNPFSEMPAAELK
ncbi:MAG: potassium channel family protein [Candidatus Hodarchaeota archaeon]